MLRFMLAFAGESELPSREVFPLTRCWLDNGSEVVLTARQCDTNSAQRKMAAHRSVKSHILDLVDVHALKMLTALSLARPPNGSYRRRTRTSAGYNPIACDFWGESDGNVSWWSNYLIIRGR